MPIVKDAQLVYTMEGPKLYYNILLQLAKMEDLVDADNPDLLRLIMDHIQIFERHWRKLVADLRQGKLDRNLNLPRAQRQRYEGIVIPRPALARKLDNIFRQLGFHKKVLGKDITIVPYAKLKRVAEPDPRRRRLSTPSTPQSRSVMLSDDRFEATFGCRTRGSTLLGSIAEDMPSSVGMGTTVGQELSSMSHSDSFWPFPGGSLNAGSSGLVSSASGGERGGGVRGRGGSPNKRQLVPLSAVETLASSTTLTEGISSATIPSNNTSKKSKKKTLAAVEMLMHSQGLKELRDQESELTIRGPSRRLRSQVRRGSDTDILRPADMAEILEKRYSHETAPRDDIGEVLPMSERYVCPFPACGRSFTGKDVAMQHLKTHEQRERLHTAVPYADQLLNYFWPAGTPWLEHAKFTQRSIPPGSLPCPMEGCSCVFPDKGHLRKHIRMIHSAYGPSSVHKGYFHMDRGAAALLVPPHPPPEDAPLRYCPNHMVPFNKCGLCVELEKGQGPKPPFSLYESVSFDFSVKNMEKDTHGGLGHDRRKFLRNDRNSCVLIREEVPIAKGGKDADASVATDGSGGSVSVGVREWKGQPVGFLIDKEDDGWMCVRQLLDVDDCRERRILLRGDFDRKHELLSPIIHGPHGEVLGHGPGRWVPMKSVVTYYHLYYMSREEFTHQQKERTIPKKGVYFIRVGDDHAHAQPHEPGRGLLHQQQSSKHGAASDHMDESGDVHSHSNRANQSAHIQDHSLSKHGPQQPSLPNIHR